VLHCTHTTCTNDMHDTSSNHEQEDTHYVKPRMPDANSWPPFLRPHDLGALRRNQHKRVS